ncbi:13834_t:CDS:2, partial [Entrophospora sp. SA101]
SPKQLQALEKEEKSIGLTKILKPISDVSTRWNSTFKAWTRLLEIKAAIVSLCDSMCEDVDREVRENGRKLKKILLKDNEWLFLENFVRILKDFDDITKLFSSRDFVSLSLVYPTIRVLIEKVKKINTNNTNINTEYDDEYIPPIDDHDLLTELESYNDEQGESPLVEGEIENEGIIFEEVNGDRKKRKLNISKPVNTEGLLEKLIQTFKIFTRE